MAVLYTEVRATFQIGEYVLHGHLCCSGSMKCQCMSTIILKQKVWNGFQWKLK